MTVGQVEQDVLGQVAVGRAAVGCRPARGRRQLLLGGRGLKHPVDRLDVEAGEQLDVRLARVHALPQDLRLSVCGDDDAVALSNQLIFSFTPWQFVMLAFLKVKWSRPKKGQIRQSVNLTR